MVLNSYKAILEKGQIKWLDTPPEINSARVIVTILPTEIELTNNTDITKISSNNTRQLGFMQGEMSIPDDINWGDEQVQQLFGV